jgi:conjugative transfer signal peptidase TraF
MIVALCAPPVAAELGRRRGYLEVGRCPSAAEPLLKVVAAVAGDSVTVSAIGVVVDGCLLRHSRALSRDAAGRPLSPWSRGHFRLRRGELWLYAADDRSWDSRYWGPMPLEGVLARAVGLLVIPAAPLDEREAGCPSAGLNVAHLIQGTRNQGTTREVTAY